jgi:uncharacterized protein involved in copper resistance
VVSGQFLIDSESNIEAALARMNSSGDDMQHDQGQMDHGDMDDDEMDHSKMDHGDMDDDEMDHSKMEHEQ